MALVSGYRGDTIHLGFSLCQSGSAFTVDSHGVTFTMKERKSDSSYIFQGDMNSGIVADGSDIVVTIPYGTSSTFKTGPHFYDIQVDTTQSGRYTLDAGTFCIHEDVGY